MEISEIHFDTIDSTNAYAKREYASFSPTAITCVIADHQTTGRGRYLRKWVSPPGVNLYATFCFRLPIETLHIPSLAIVMSYSFTSILLEEGLHPKIKWPNDVQIHKKKLSGVLCETIFGREEVQVLLGIGINVNMEEEDLKAIDQPATSLKNETGKVWDRKALMKKLELCFISDLDRFKKEGFVPFLKRVEALLAYKGEKIRCYDGKTEWVGFCDSLGTDGRLNLRLLDGQLHPIFSGDISL